MFKKVMQRAFLGFPMGVFIGYTITVLISLFLPDGSYSPVVPSLTQSMGSELNAVILQYLLSGVLGAGAAAGSVVWEIESWSTLKRTLVHLVITSVLMFPIAYLNHWMEPTIAGIASYVLIFVVIYTIIWLAQYFFWMRRVRQINQRLENK